MAARKATRHEQAGDVAAPDREQTADGGEEQEEHGACIADEIALEGHDEDVVPAMRSGSSRAMPAATPFISACARATVMPGASRATTSRKWRPR
jgi:hypothetical protein